MLSKETINGAISDYKNGLSLSSIVKRRKLNKYLIYYYLKKFEIPRRRKRNFYRNEQIKQIISLYKGGISLSNIANQFGITRDAVYSILKRRGIYKRRSLLKKRDILKAIKEYQKGSNTYELGRKFGVSFSFIKNLLIKHGIKIRNHAEARQLTMKKIKHQRGLVENKALLFGLLLSDGSEAGGYKITLATRDKIFPEFVISLVNKIYGINGKYDKKRKVIEWYSKNMLNEIHQYVPTLIHKPTTKTFIPVVLINNPRLRRMFLKGYFSMDGAVVLVVEKDGTLRREISLDCYNPFLLKNICEMLQREKINFGIYKNQISIHSEKEFIKFEKRIGFLPVKIQKSKIWRGFRKDILLKLVIKTYTTNFNRKFNSKEEGRNYLKEEYKMLEKMFKPMLAEPGSKKDLERKDLIFEPKVI